MSEKSQVPKGYKKTELGVVPEEWKIFQVDQLVNVNGESRDPTKNSEELFYYIDIDAVENESGLIKYPKRLSGKEAPSRARRVIHKDDVIMSTVRPYHKAFALVPQIYENQICSTGFAVLSCGKNLDPKYLLHYLLSDKVIDQCISMMAGGQYPALNTSQVSKIKIAFPPLPEQQKIASILSKVNEQIEQTKQIIEKTELLIKGLRQQLLTKGIGHTKFKKTELGEIPEEWEVCKFIKYIDIKSGKGFKLEEYSDSGIKLLRIDNVSHGKIVWDTIAYLPNEYADKNQDLVLEEGDILLALNRPVTQNKLKIGILKQEDLPSILYQRVGKITFNRKINSYYVYHWLTMFLPNFISKKAVGSDQPFINLTDLRKMTFFVPSEIEQQKIASILSKVDSQIQDNQNYLTRLLELKKGLMHDLLTGKVRVCI
ncbi:restriction endonuclease subunit S [Methanosarcina mazei]|uniref:Type I restriction modification DNA specificity domain-containing protein n=1 Tax=Methanosarcina mazei TaxID=2209 RepID=A0A0F8DWI6_METMZ|nr:restriction endonuclease subunit S [Methanosarcina mazei]KKG07033.1 hypothetical protein DU47_04305 [Methanosarcina mazei]KKH91380.1 hypothetical protein DU80_11570 [Methanosarcina mazei]